MNKEASGDEYFFLLPKECEVLVGSKSRVGVLTINNTTLAAKAIFKYWRTQNFIPTTLSSEQISRIEIILKEDAWAKAPQIAT